MHTHTNTQIKQDDDNDDEETEERKKKTNLLDDVFWTLNPSPWLVTPLLHIFILKVHILDIHPAITYQHWHLYIRSFPNSPLYQYS